MKAIGYGIGLAGCALAATWADVAGLYSPSYTPVARVFALVCLLGLLFTKGEK